MILERPRGIQPGRSFDIVLRVDVLLDIADDDGWAKAGNDLQAWTDPAGHILVRDHLADESQIDSCQSGRTRHTRWRSLTAYQTVLKECRLQDHSRYDTAAEGRPTTSYCLVEGLRIPNLTHSLTPDSVAGMAGAGIQLP